MENQDTTHQSSPMVEKSKTSGQKVGQPASPFGEFTPNQKRALAVMVVIALGFGAYFLRNYLQLIAIAGVLAYLFRPLYLRFKNRMKAGLASALTLLCALLIVIVPLTGILAMAAAQIKQMIDNVSEWASETDTSELGDRVLTIINDALGKIPFVDFELTTEKLQSGFSSVASGLGDFALNFAKSSVGGIAAAVTMAIIFLYVFLALLGRGEKIVEVFRDLSPLDSEITDIYLSKIGSMAKATVGGQFVIALAQGAAGAASIYIAGIHQGFFMFLIFLTVLSIIPLGSGIVAIPLGIIMALTGNVTGGIFVVLFHILVTSNIDNVLRPMLVPRSAYLPPALMLLAVFAGLAMFGFLGIVFGPVIMIIIVTTINLYRVVIKGADWEDDGDGGEDGKAAVESKNKNPWRRFTNWLSDKRRAKATKN